MPLWSCTNFSSDTASEVTILTSKRSFWQSGWWVLGGIHAFVEDLAHGYDETLAGAKDDQSTADDWNKSLFLAIASSQVKAL